MRSKLALPFILCLFVMACPAAAQVASNFQLVGQNPLFNRGMNSQVAIFENFLYIGNRTDGSSRCGLATLVEQILALAWIPVPTLTRVY